MEAPPSAFVHGVPSAAVGFEHAPLLGSQVPATWHPSLAVQFTGLDPVQLPAEHAYVAKHLLLPMQVVPSAAVGFEHAPLPGSQVPATWHVSLAVHITALEPVQVPAEQA